MSVPSSTPNQPPARKQLFAPRVAVSNPPRSLWNELYSENPMLDESRREQRRFFRGSTAGSGCARTVVLSIVGLIYLWSIAQAVWLKTDIGELMLYLQLVLLTLVLPASIYSAISGERERSTWEALIMTRLTSAQIIAGKLIWRLRIMLLISLFILPPLIGSRVLALTLNTTPTSIVAAEAVITSWGLLLCCFGLWVSSMTQRSIATLTTIVLTLLALLLALPVLFSLFAQALNSGNYSNNEYETDVILTTILNPFVMLSPIVRHNWPFHNDMDWGSNIITGWPLIGAYLAGSVIFILLTHLRLGQLNRPQYAKLKSRRGTRPSTREQNHA